MEYQIVTKYGIMPGKKLIRVRKIYVIECIINIILVLMKIEDIKNNVIIINSNRYSQKKEKLLK